MFTKNALPWAPAGAPTATGSKAGASSNAQPPRLPTFHASALGPWLAFVSYEACVRLCLRDWKAMCPEAAMFLDNECSLLIDAFGLQTTLLQPKKDLIATMNCNAELFSSEGVAPNPKKHKMKVQVCEVKMGLDPPTGCSMSSVITKLSSGLHALRKFRFGPHLPANGVTTLWSSSSSYEAVQETHCCILRLKSSLEKDAIKLQSGSSEVLKFFPDSLEDDLLVEVQDSKGKHFGSVLIQLAAIADNPADKVRWWPIYWEPYTKLVGKIQLNINYSTTADDNSHLKCGTVSKTVAYDLVLEAAMKVQGFQQRNLIIHGPWKWLLSEFASYYGVSEVYTKLRYLSYVMDVATPTADCLNLVYDLLAPVIQVKGNSKTSLSHQENQILGEIKVEIERILTFVFENYKSLDESSFSGITEIFGPRSGHVVPALEPAIKLYKLLLAHQLTKRLHSLSF